MATEKIEIEWEGGWTYFRYEWDDEIGWGLAETGPIESSDPAVWAEKFLPVGSEFLQETNTLWVSTYEVE